MLSKSRIVPQLLTLAAAPFFPAIPSLPFYERRAGGPAASRRVRLPGTSPSLSPLLSCFAWYSASMDWESRGKVVVWWAIFHKVGRLHLTAHLWCNWRARRHASRNIRHLVWQSLGFFSCIYWCWTMAFLSLQSSSALPQHLVSSQSCFAAQDPQIISSKAACMQLSALLIGLPCRRRLLR